MSTDTLSAALFYAARGWPVLPLWPVVETGDAYVCACRDGSRCKAPGKHPACDGGVTRATCDAARVRAFWERFAARWSVAPSVGIATGGALCVIDLDARHYGDETWERLTHGREAGETVEAITGGGRHLYLALDGRERVPSSAGRLGPGVDVRAEGGYVVAPPSRHVGGRYYVWEAASDPTDGVALATAPAWLVALATAPATQSPSRRLASGETVSEGGRNDALMRAACSWRARGVELAELREALDALNASACDPPLSPREVGRIAAGVVRRYRPGLSPRVLRVSVAAELRVGLALASAGAYAFKSDPAWWAASLSGDVPEDPERGEV